MSDCFKHRVRVVQYYQRELGYCNLNSCMIPSQGEEEHKKKISKLPKSFRLPNGERIQLR